MSSSSSRCIASAESQSPQVQREEQVFIHECERTPVARAQSRLKEVKYKELNGMPVKQELVKKDNDEG